MKSLDKIVGRIEEVFAVTAFSAMSIITVVAVFFRYVLNNPIIWSEEAARYLMIWGICIGISIATRKKAHLGIDVFVSLTPQQIHKPLEILSSILLILTYVLLVVLSIQFIASAVKTANVSPILRISFWKLYLALPIGFGLSTIRAAQVLVEIVRGVPTGTEEVGEVLL